MDPTASGSFEARGGTVNAINLWEIGNLSGAVVIPGTYVLVTTVQAEDDPATIAYVFTQPPYLFS